MIRLTVILATYNPNPLRLRRTLQGLRAQTLATDFWETLLIDNASQPAVEAGVFHEAPANLIVLREPRSGLSHARRRGFMAARGELIVLVDDDNVLTADYLEHVIALFAAHPQIGACGGRSLPEFEQAPAPWLQEFYGLLALRDLGPAPLISENNRAAPYPAYAPIGAGMALRRDCAQAWARQSSGPAITDRRGAELTSGGDNDIVLTVLGGGSQVAYFPELILTHLIPSSRLDPRYLARLNRGIQKSWMHVLTKHRANPWPRIHPWTLPLRKARTWLTHHGWSAPTGHIRWQGACGHFEGRV